MSFFRFVGDVVSYLCLLVGTLFLLLAIGIIIGALFAGIALPAILVYKYIL